MTTNEALEALAVEFDNCAASEKNSEHAATSEDWRSMARASGKAWRRAADMARAAKDPS